MNDSIRWAPLALFISLGAASAKAEITYTLTPDVAKNQLHVSIKVPNSTESKMTFEIPAWAPGSYVLNRGAENVSDVKVTFSNGGMASVTNIGRGKWYAASRTIGDVTLEYTLPMPTPAGAAHFAGPTTYMYVADRKREACRLIFNAPDKWNVVTGLDSSGPGKFEYVAPNYDTLADNPITAGDFLLDTYRVAGKTHYICLYGAARNLVDRPFLKKTCAAISSAETDFFGGAPYNKYVWHFRVNEGLDGGGGLEHLSSTEISMASGMGPGVIGVYAHEFFHLWNVKRIRSKALGPFDYTQLPQTGALWWLEGVTDYYAYNLMRRYGMIDDRAYFEELVGQARSLRSNPARLTNSPFEASFRVRDAAGGRGNSQGFGISYYLAGHQLGFVFDIELLNRTKGKYSLDDVELALWQMCRDNQPGFEEGEIRRQLVRFGDEELGQLYDRVVMSAGEIPLESALNKIGFRMMEKDVVTIRANMTGIVSATRKGYIVSSVRDGEAGVQPDDLIVAANGMSLEYGTTHQIIDAWKRATEKATAGATIPVQVVRTVNGKPTKLEVKLGFRATTAKRLTIEESESPTADQLALRKKFLAAHRK